MILSTSKKKHTVQHAHSAHSTRLACAHSQANRLVQQAKADVRETIEKVKGDKPLLQSTWAVDHNARFANAYRLYLEILETILFKVKLAIVQPQTKTTTMPHHVLDATLPVGTIQPKPEPRITE